MSTNTPTPTFSRDWQADYKALMKDFRALQKQMNKNEAGLAGTLAGARLKLELKERDLAAANERLEIAIEALQMARASYECRGDYYDGFASEALRKLNR